MSDIKTRSRLPWSHDTIPDVDAILRAKPIQGGSWASPDKGASRYSTKKGKSPALANNDRLSGGRWKIAASRRGQVRSSYRDKLELDRTAGRGMAIVIDRAVSLLSEHDEQRLADKLAQTADTEALWPAIESMILGDAATTVTAGLGVMVLTILYRDHREHARELIRELLLSDSIGDIDLGIRFINDVEDPAFRDQLLSLQQRPGLPGWLQDTIEDALSELATDL